MEISEADKYISKKALIITITFYFIVQTLVQSMAVIGLDFKPLMGAITNSAVFKIEQYEHKNVALQAQVDFLTEQNRKIIEQMISGDKNPDYKSRLEHVEELAHPKTGQK